MIGFLHLSSIAVTFSTVEKVWFGVSLVLLSFGAGVATQAGGWLPTAYVGQAWAEVERMIPSSGPDFSYPAVYDREGVRIEQPQKMQDGLTLLASEWEGAEGWHPEVRLVDRDGKTVHRWTIRKEALFQSETHRKDPTQAGVHGVQLLPDGDVVVNVEYVGMARLDACSTVQWTLTEANHHTIEQEEDGSFWTPGVSDTRRTTTPAYPNGYPGIETPVWMDQLLRVSSGGTVMERINVLDVLRSNGLERYIAKGMGPRVQRIVEDPVHLNDIEPLPDSLADGYPLFEGGDLLISLRYPDLVFVLDPETKDVKWYESRHFTRQHDPDFIGNGWIGVFDNQRDNTDRGTLLGGTRIVKVQPHTDSVAVPFPSPHSEPHYTESQGKWQQLDNGNMLIAETHAGRVVEVDSSGQTVWEWIHPPTENGKVPSVTKAVRYDLTKADVASWSCASDDR
jgi:hypothetical protein